MTTTKTTLYRLHNATNHNYDFSNLEVGNFYPVEGRLCQFKGTKEFSNKTEYTFSDWRLGGGRVYTVYHNIEAECEAFDKVVSWGQDRCLDRGTRLCDGQIIETLSKCQITDNTIIAEYHNNKSRQAQRRCRVLRKKPTIKSRLRVDKTK